MNQGTDTARQEYVRERQAHWDRVAQESNRWRGSGRGYHRRLEHVYRHLVPPGHRVLELGCGEGDLLAALQPAVGVGVDFSAGMVERARQCHPGLQFVQADAAEFAAGESFDAIILSDLVNDLWDVQAVLERVARLARPETRVILNFYSHLWELPLGAASALGLAKPRRPQNWMTPDDVTNLLELAGFEVVRRWHEVLWPVRTPGLEGLCNRVLAKLWPLSNLALANFALARRRAPRRSPSPPPRVSVIVPARNEQGNIARILERVPELGGGTELVFVEGHSRDDTYAEIERQIAAHPHRRCKLARQTGEGKGDAVRLGFSLAKGDVLMILDADLTVVPEDLPRFYEALVSGKGEFINGVRLVYPMEKQAMRFFNLVGNKFFSLAFSWLLGQSIKDTLCGTKVLWKTDYERIAANRGCFGEFDPFGDYDLLFGAARLGLRIVDLPIRYRERTYGSTQIRRWKHGLLLLRMVAFAARRLKFV
jgi:SAM-dependent methyltransferase